MRARTLIFLGLLSLISACDDHAQGVEVGDLDAVSGEDALGADAPDEGDGVDGADAVDEADVVDGADAADAADPDATSPPDDPITAARVRYAWEGLPGRVTSFYALEPDAQGRLVTREGVTVDPGALGALAAALDDPQATTVDALPLCFESTDDYPSWHIEVTRASGARRTLRSESGCGGYLPWGILAPDGTLRVSLSPDLPRGLRALIEAAAWRPPDDVGWPQLSDQAIDAFDPDSVGPSTMTLPQQTRGYFGFIELDGVFPFADLDFNAQRWVGMSARLGLAGPVDLLDATLSLEGAAPVPCHASRGGGMQTSGGELVITPTVDLLLGDELAIFCAVEAPDAVAGQTTRAEVRARYVDASGATYETRGEIAPAWR